MSDAGKERLTILKSLESGFEFVRAVMNYLPHITILNSPFEVTNM